MTARAAALAVVAVLGTVSCGTPLIKLPSGVGAPAADAGGAVAQATSACRAVRTLTAEIAVSGSSGGHRVRGRLLAGVSAPASVRLEAVAPFGPPLFIFVATGDDATLLLPRDDRALEHGRPDAVLAAITGVRLGAADLHALLTGCPLAPAEPAQGRQMGDRWRVVPAGRETELYFHRERDAAPWRLVAFVRRNGTGQRAWRAEFGDFQGDLPRSIHVTSTESVTSDAGFDLHLALSQVDINVPLEADVFRVQIPKTAVPTSLEELRRSGPLAAPGKTGRVGDESAGVTDDGRRRSSASTRQDPSGGRRGSSLSLRGRSTGRAQGPVNEQWSP